jgi:hypothetical protein
MTLDRNDMLKASGFTALTFMVGGASAVLTAAEARAADLPYRTLSAAEVRTLDALGETLLPGAAAAGLSHFVDQQISGPPVDALLMLRYVDWPPPYARFYQLGLAALDNVARTQSGRDFADLSEADRRPIVRALGAPAPNPAWNAPVPARLFYFALRSDAVDVVYGTVEGFAKLEVPYMPHIVPTRSW